MVKVGDPLVSLDPADARVVLEQAEANVAQTVRQVRGLFANHNQYQAQMAQRQADLSRAQDDLRRRLPVAQTGAVSQEEISHARDAVKSACGASGFFGHRFRVKRVFQTGVVHVEESGCESSCARGAGRRA